MSDGDQLGVGGDLPALTAQAESGDARAALKLSVALENAGQLENAFSWLCKAARGGNGIAATLLGERLVLGHKAPQDLPNGAAWIEAAAKAGFAEALRRHCILAAVGVGRPQSWADAWTALAAAAARGHGPSGSQIRLLNMIGIAGANDIGNFLSPPKLEVRVASPKITMAEGLFPEAICRWLIERARPKLQSVPIYNADGGLRTDSIRSNTGAGFALFETDLVIQLARARVAAAVATPVSRQEPLHVLHYSPGERYLPHWDYFDPSVEGYRADLERGGQRVRTALVYLNDDFDGGETGFVKLGLGFRARTGGLLAFENVHADGGIDPRTMHEGRPTTRGEKWLLSVWMRDRDHEVV